MLITNLSVENLKSFGERQEAPLADITLVYGPNSAGKSTLIQSLLLLKQTMDAAKEYRAHLIARGPFVDLGSFSALVHLHDIERPVVIGVTGLFDPEYHEQPLPILDAERSKAKTDFTFMWDETLRSATHRSTSIDFGGERFTFERITEVMYDVSMESENIFSRYRYGAFKLVGKENETPRYFVSEDLLPSEEFARMGRNYTEPYPLEEFGESDYANEAAWSEYEKYLEEHRAEFVRQRFQEQRKQSENVVNKLEWLRSMRPSPEDEGVDYWQYRDNFNSIVHIGPVRSVPERFHILSNHGNKEVGRNGENMTDALVYSGADRIYIDAGEIVSNPKVGLHSEILEAINGWLGTLGVSYNIEIQPIRADFIGDAVALTLVHRQSKVRVSMADVGYGISQVLPIIVQCCLSERSIICIEQPELHIHPRLQAEMADLFIDCVGLSERFNWANTVDFPDEVTDGATVVESIEDSITDRGITGDDQSDSTAFFRPVHAITGLEDIYNQVIVETHSEHLLLRLQRRIREGKIRNTNVSVLYVDPLPDGSSTIRPIRLDEDGSMIDEWPGGFFEERYNEIFGR
ncbi:MAG: AAA family ATPase [Thermomicrobiales bacterium]